MAKNDQKQRSAWQHLLLVGCSLGLLGAATADDKPSFVRITDDADGAPLALQVAVARYEAILDGRARVVDLIGAVHIAEPDYYASLNTRFTEYDTVLYELVAPEGTRVQPGQKPDGWLSKTQFAMTQGLDLAFQLDGIDYQAENLLHADLSPSEFKTAMRERGESPIVMAWRVFSFSMSEGAKNALPQNQLATMKDLFASKGDNGLKVMLARELTKTDQLSSLLGDDANNSIIGARNERAIEVLRTALESRANERLAIFYGVAHLPDFDRRMIDELGFERREIIWLDAWALQ